jgi:hypothetical protein
MSLSEGKFDNTRLGRDTSSTELSFSASAAEEQAVLQGVRLCWIRYQHYERA